MELQSDCDRSKSSDLDLESASSSELLDMSDGLDVPDWRCSSNAQGCSSRMDSGLDADLMGMQVSSSEDGSSTRDRTQVMALDSDSSVDVEAAGNHLCSSSGPARKKTSRGSTARMPAFGSCSGNRSHLQQQGEPDIEKLEPLKIHLKQVPFAETFVTPRHSAVVQPGSEPTLRVYGTIRCFSATHRVPKILTRRNKLELLSCLRFDPEFAEKTSPSEWQRLRVVSASFAEWLMGLPHGWTSCVPLDSAEDWESTMCPQASQQRIRRWTSISLFSGCGALDLALLPWATPVLYCEKEPGARQVLRARTGDGSLPHGSIIDDVADISAATLQGLPEKPQMLTAGFPCQDICQAGQQRGLEGSRSCLFFQIVRLVDECPCLCVVFLENVDAIRSLEQVWCVVLDAFLDRGFCARWVSLPATAAGCPQHRKRWFFLARRGESAHVPFADSLPLPIPDVPGVSCRPRVHCPAQRSGVNFNSGRPCPSSWLANAEDYNSLRPRLRMCGNAVVPHQARLAAQLLSTDW